MTSPNLLDYYQQWRKRNIPAKQALVQAKYAIQADITKDEFQTLESDGLVRLSIEPDECVDLDFLLGETYDPDLNPSINPQRLERERQQEIDRINNEGVWGIVGQYHNGKGWVSVDSVWGFIGDDWKASGYDDDIMKATIDAYRAQTCCRLCHKPN